MKNIMCATALTFILSGSFGEKAYADTPLLFEPSDSPFTHTVHGCTQDDVLMEVRFTFDINPHYARLHLGTPEKLADAVQQIDDFVENELQDKWKDILQEINFTEIESGHAKPLQLLLEELYSYTDRAFNISVVGVSNDNIMPVLRGGAYDSGHDYCLP